MCGRFTLKTPPQVVAELFGLDEVPAWEPRYNIAPTQPVAAVRAARDGGQRELVFLHWGLIPSWADDWRIGNRMINARSETVAEKPAFRRAFRQRRCLVPADGFFEWQRQGTKKQPYYIHRRDGRPLAIAGLWEHWAGAGSGPVESCTLLTTAANATLRPLHDRMPVLLEPAQFDTWLDPEQHSVESLVALLAPADDAVLEAYAVSTVVNSPRNDSPACIEPKPA